MLATLVAFAIVGSALAGDLMGRESHTWSNKKPRLSSEDGAERATYVAAGRADMLTQVIEAA